MISNLRNSLERMRRRFRRSVSEDVKEVKTRRAAVVGAWSALSNGSSLESVVFESTRTQQIIYFGG